MLLTTLSLFHLAAGLLARDQVHTIFDRGRHPGSRRSCAGTASSLLAIILVTEIGFLQRIFSMVDLSLEQWWICIGLALEPRGGRGADQVLHPAARPDARPRRTARRGHGSA